MFLGTRKVILYLHVPYIRPKKHCRIKYMYVYMQCTVMYVYDKITAITLTLSFLSAFLQKMTSGMYKMIIPSTVPTTAAF